jgi:hypothetical protein
MRAIQSLGRLAPAAALCLTLLSFSSANAALLLDPQQTQLSADQASFSLTLRLDQPITFDPGFDSFQVDLTYSAASVVTAASAMPLALLTGAPDPLDPSSFWNVSDPINESLFVDRVAAAPGGSLPAGELLQLGFNVVNPGSPFTLSISAAITFRSIDPEMDLLTLTSAPVTVTAVPEPARAGLLAAGMALVGVQITRRRRRGRTH